MFKDPLILTDLQEEGASRSSVSAALYLHEVLEDKKAKPTQFQPAY